MTTTSAEPDLAVDDDGVVHVVYNDSGIQYTYSDDYGDTWSTPLAVTSTVSPTRRPVVALDSNGNVHIAYTITNSSSYQEIYYSKVDSSGALVIEELALTSSASVYDEIPEIAVDSSDYVHVVSEYYVPYSGYEDITYYRSNDGGTSWSEAVLFDGSAYGGSFDHPHLAVDGSYVYVVAAFDNDYAYLARSSNNGSSWSGPSALPLNCDSGSGSCYAKQPSVAAYGGNVHVVVPGYSSESGLSYLRSTNYASSWASETYLALAHTNYSHASADESGVYAVVPDSTVEYVESLDGGESWSGLLDFGAGYYPRVDSDPNGVVHLVVQTSSGIEHYASELPQVCPEIDLLTPETMEVLAEESIEIEWEVSDANGDPLNVALYYDTDTSSGGTVALTTSSSESSTYIWDVSDVPAGEYSIYARVDDSICEVDSYSDGTVLVNHPPELAFTAPSASGDTTDAFYTIEWSSLDPDADELSIDLYYDTDTDSADMTLIEADIEDLGWYSWNTADFDEGASYYLYAEVSDGVTTTYSTYSDGMVTVDHPNQDPVLTGLPDPSVSEDGSLDNAFSLTTYASDHECGVSIDADAMVDVAPTANWYGSCDITVTVTDDEGATAQDDFTVTVVSVNDAPTIDSYSPTTTSTTVLEGTGSISYTVSASDVEGDTLVYTWYESMSSAGSGTSHTFSYAPGTTGSITISVLVSDGTDTDSQLWTVEILPDTDQDGVSDEDEAALGTDPEDDDTDDDGLTDGDEVDIHGTDPLLDDTDSDGLSDGDEIDIHGTDPLLDDTDDDGLVDGDETDLHGTDPLDDDSDDDDKYIEKKIRKNLILQKLL